MTTIQPLSTLQLYVKTARLAVPAILENLFISAVFLVDALMIAHLNSAAALAAAGICGTVMWRLRGVAASLQVGIGAFVSRRWGAGDSSAARNAFTHGALIGFCIGLCFLVLYPFTRLAFKAMHAEESVLACVMLYFQPILLVFPLRVASVHMAAALRAAGDTRTPMFTTIAMNITHVCSNSMLIFGNLGAPALGIRGAGISTALAMTMEFIVLLIIGFRGVKPKRLFATTGVATTASEEDEIDAVAPVYTPAPEREDVLRFSREGFRFWLPGVTGKILRLSHPTFWEEIALSVGFITFISMIADLGEKSLAAHTCITRIESFSFNAGFGATIAASTLVGQALGAGSVGEARRALSACLTLSVCMMGSAGIAFSISPGWFLHWFAGGQSSGFMTLAVPLFFLTAITQPFLGMTSVLAGGLRGAGQTVAPFVAQMIGVIGVRIGLGYYLTYPLGMGMEGIYIAMVCDWLLRSSVLGAIVIFTRWDKTIV